MSLTLSVPAWSLISSLNRSACIVNDRQWIVELMGHTGQ